VLALIAAGTAIVLVVRSGTSAAGEVFLDPADQTGPNPFTNAQVAPLSSTTSSTVNPTTTVATGKTIAATSGSRPGLYGGTNDSGRCDPKQLVSFLQANPDKARAWVKALNSDPSLRWTGGTKVNVDQIGAYVAELTPVTLIADTRVTNYGFANGKPTPRQAVLQRGTAVLVDGYGVPRTKCSCGNPLTKPTAVKSTPTYTGDAWPGWNPATVVVVAPATQVVTTFVIVNLAGPGYLDRPAGSTGDRDTTSSFTGDGTTASTSTSTPSTAPPTAGTPSTLPPSDFCAQFQALQSKWSGASADTLAQRQALLADFDTLTAAAPGDVKADMQIISAYLRSTIDTPDNFNPPADEQAAETRVTAYLTNVCGIVIN